MLSLVGITKWYPLGNEQVEALRGVDISFRRSEFVSVLGPSGCGKTTLLNIIGGLDRYSQGDLRIGGRSTKDYRDADWDAYRNHSIGFVFQNYHLIPHQSVLSNVELALTLAGVSKAERRRRAAAVLQRVGLGDHLRKRPNQLSGGQMQRVAIARALINNPEILLADEPTGALDSETSVQIMELLKEISQEKLVIMVTHNPDLAEQYSSRIVRLLDGRVIDDSDPYTEEEPAPAAEKKTKKRQKGTSMSFFTALSLSMNNLLTKKGRTLLTSFAGSIGIIGIALILSLSSGFQAYIDRVQQETLASYPLSIQRETADMSGVMVNFMKAQSEEVDHPLDRVYANRSISKLMEALTADRKENRMKEFKEFVDSSADIKQYTTAVQYGYDFDLQVYRAETDDGVVQVNPNTVLQSLGGNTQTTAMMSGGMTDGNVWREMLGNETFLSSQYETVVGRWPRAYNEVVLIVDKNNEISEIALYALGLKDQSELSDMLAAYSRGEKVETEDVSFSYDEMLALTFKVVLNCDYFEQNEEGGWTDLREDEDRLKALVDAGEEIRVVGVMRSDDKSSSASGSAAIGYTAALTEWVATRVNESEIVKAQKADETVDVFTGHAFDEANKTYTMEDVRAYVAGLPAEQQAQMAAAIAATPEDKVLADFTKRMKAAAPQTTYAQNLATLGVVDLDQPSTVYLYPIDFESKDALKDLIGDYNDQMKAQGKDDYAIEYTDYIGMLMSSISNIIAAISYVLIAFVAISLVVSSIMIGIITYISVLERTKEIGILRAMGASKRDVSRVFNAETFIVGLAAGLIGIGICLLLIVPINNLIEAVGNIPDCAYLPVGGAAVLVLISMVLTVIAGLIPAKIAATKDPVVALRTE